MTHGQQPRANAPVAAVGGVGEGHSAGAGAAVATGRPALLLPGADAMATAGGGRRAGGGEGLDEGTLEGRANEKDEIGGCIADALGRKLLRGGRRVSGDVRMTQCARRGDGALVSLALEDLKAMSRCLLAQDSWGPRKRRCASDDSKIERGPTA